MICTKCNSDGVLNEANGNQFYYCRTCKEEIILTGTYDSDAVNSVGNAGFFEEMCKDDDYDNIPDEYDDYYWF